MSDGPRVERLIDPDDLPRLAQPWWYRLVGLTHAKQDEPSTAGQKAARRQERKRRRIFRLIVEES
jgi:hypothetical protein